LKSVLPTFWLMAAFEMKSPKKEILEVSRGGAAGVIDG
jgi:hypothetical protein